MDKIDKFDVEPLENGRFVKPYRLTYLQNSVSKSWEVVSVHPSVSIIIFNKDTKKVVLVRQFRPAVYFSSYSRSERELQSPTAASSTSSAATQHTTLLSSQQTQTAQQSRATQETQTTHAFQKSSQQQQQPCDKPDVCQTSKATQSIEVIQSSQSMQSEVIPQASQSTQSCALQLAHHYSSSEGGCTTSPKRKCLPSLPGRLGITLELCAGIVDKEEPLRNIAREEVLEECGYDVGADAMEEVISFRTGVGETGSKQTMFFVEVTNAMKVGEGGGLAAEGELIECVELSIPEVRDLLSQKEVMSPGGLLFGLMWFLSNKAAKYQ